MYMMEMRHTEESNRKQEGMTPVPAAVGKNIKNVVEGNFYKQATDQMRIDFICINFHIVA